MLINIGFEFEFESEQETPMVVMLYTHPSRGPDLLSRDSVRADPSVPIEEYLDMFGNRCGRLVAPSARFHLWCDAVVRDDGIPDEICPDAIQHAIAELPAETLTYLVGSRYCETDKLSEQAWQLFGATTPGWSRVQAICNWVHNNVTFGYKFARWNKTAHDVFVEGTGVCRDFAHLAITLCRCMNIPARYATGYLGDIGVPEDPNPMDFSAWFEVFLGGRWYTFDARHNTPRIGRVLMARGRDATDVAMTTSFGNHRLTDFKVWTNEVESTDELGYVGGLLGDKSTLRGASGSPETSGQPSFDDDNRTRLWSVESRPDIHSLTAHR